MATDIRWPEGLRGILTTGKSRGQGPTFTMSDPKKAPPYVKNTSTDVPVFWDVTFRFTADEAQIFWDWFEKKTLYGRRYFIMPVKTEYGLVEHEVVFVPEDLLKTTENGGVFTYTAKIMARKLVIPSKYRPDYLKCSIVIGENTTSSQYNYGYYKSENIGAASDVSTTLYAPDNGSLATLAGYHHRNSKGERGILFSILDKSSTVILFLNSDPLTTLTVKIDGGEYNCGAYDSYSSSGNYVWNNSDAAALQEKWFDDSTVGASIFIEFYFTHSK